MSAGNTYASRRQSRHGIASNTAHQGRAKKNLILSWSPQPPWERCVRATSLPPPTFLFCVHSSLSFHHFSADYKMLYYLVSSFSLYFFFFIYKSSFSFVNEMLERLSIFKIFFYMDKVSIIFRITFDL